MRGEMAATKRSIQNTTISPHIHRGLNRAQRTNLTFYGFLTPWLLGFIFLTVIPLVIALALSFTNYDGMNWDSMKFVKLNNYIRAFSDDRVAYSLQRTLLWLLFYVPLWMIISFSLALLLNQNIKGKGFFRVLYYLPSVVPASAAVIVWKTLLDKNTGLLNASISFFKPGTAIGWLSTYSLQSLAVIVLWTGLGAGMIIFLAGLQNIPGELIEAARIDGASNWDILRYIILPLMSPVIFLQLILGLIAAFQQLTYPFLISYVNYSGGISTPPRGVFFYMVNTYLEIRLNQRYAYGSALLWLFFIGILILTGLVFWSQKFWVYTGEVQEERR
jgi:multiple sugar transport system permease protein